MFIKSPVFSIDKSFLSILKISNQIEYVSSKWDNANAYCWQVDVSTTKILWLNVVEDFVTLIKLKTNAIISLYGLLYKLKHKKWQPV